jgi:type II secretory pathway component GspD/PulD (secretin)
MVKIRKNVPAALFLVLISILTSFAQQVSPTAAQKSESDFVTEKGFKSKVFEIKYRDADSIARVLRNLGSGFKGASMSSNSEFKTLTVRDFPENLATIEEALKRLDAPAAPRPNIQLHMHVLVASDATSSAATNAPVPNELKDVLAQLRETLSYRNYELAASVVQRLTETPRLLTGQGTAEISGANPSSATTLMPYQYHINSVSLMQNPTGAPTVQIQDFSFSILTDKDRAQVQTALNLRDGEKVVVGTATIRNRALVVVLTAKLVN